MRDGFNFKPTTKVLEFFSDCVAGGVSAIASKTIIAPIERVKLLLQTQHVNVKLEGKYVGLSDCVKRVYKEQGFISFWRGNLANIIRFFPNHALSFAFKDQIKETFVGSATKQNNFWRFLAGTLFAGGMAGGISLLACHPLDIMRTKLAADVGTGKKTRLYQGYWCCTKEIYTKSGLMGFYKGIGISLFGVVLFKAFFLGGYDIAKAVCDLDKLAKYDHQGHKISKNSSIGARFVVAQVVTTVVGTICYPLDTIRRRIMMQVQSQQGEFLYRNGWHCARLIMQHEGIHGFFAGYSANVLRGFGGAILLVGYDEVKQLFRILSAHYNHHDDD